MAKAKKEKMITRTFTFSEVNVRYVNDTDDTVNYKVIIIPNADKYDETTLIKIAAKEIGYPVVNAFIIATYTKRYTISEADFIANATVIE